MKNATTLVIQGASTKVGDLAPLIAATKAQEGKLNALLVGPVAPMPSYAVGAAPYAAAVVPAGWVEKRNTISESLSTAQAALRTAMIKDSMSGEVATLCIEAGAIADPVAARSAFADLVILRNDLRPHEAAFRNAAYAVLFKSPTPLLLNSEANEKSAAPESVMIAWNDSLPAARAVHASLPMLKEAKEITIACFDPVMSDYLDGESPGADLASWLSHHGCNVSLQEVPTGGKSVAEAMKQKAREVQADVVVMGAYGRSRLNEAIFGGTTRYMLDQQVLPVLMAH